MLEDRASGAWPSSDCTLVSPEPLQGYSGMIAGVLRGEYQPSQAQVDLPGLCGASDTVWMQGRVVSLDPQAGQAVLEDGRRLTYDVASLDVGSELAGRGLPGVRDHAWPVRPLSAALRLRERLDALSLHGGTVPVVLVGAGAAGVEIASAVESRIRGQGAHPDLTLIEAGPDALGGHSPAARRRVRRHLRRRGITLRTGARVREVTEAGVRLDDGGAVPAAMVVWATGAAPHPLIEASGLETTDRGYIRVDATLRADSAAGTGAPRIFGAGDCVDLAGHELPRSGVYAVREGEVLRKNLRLALAGQGADSLIRYTPQQRALSLLDTADGKAIASWGGLSVHSRVAWWVKDRIDTRFVERHQVHAPKE